MIKKLFYIFLLSITLHAAAYNLSDYEALKKTNKCEGCNLSDVDLSSLTLKNIDLTASNLSNAIFSDTNLERSKLDDVIMTSSNFYKANGKKNNTKEK